MTIIDAQTLDANPELSTDVCVIGGGAAGITVARELAGSALDVLLVESGGRKPDEDTQSLYDLESTGYPVRENFMSRARYFGGSCNLWAGRNMRLEAFDIGDRPWVGCDAWPIDHAELAKYFQRASDLLGLPPLEWFDREGGVG